MKLFETVRNRRLADAKPMRASRHAPFQKLRAQEEPKAQSAKSPAPLRALAHQRIHDDAEYELPNHVEPSQDHRDEEEAQLPCQSREKQPPLELPPQSVSRAASSHSSRPRRLLFFALRCFALSGLITTLIAMGCVLLWEQLPTYDPASPPITPEIPRYVTFRDSPPILPLINLYERSAAVGAWGGSCECPNGERYLVGDNLDACESLACFGGTAGKCSHTNGEWSGRRVVCDVALTHALLPSAPPPSDGLPIVPPASSSAQSRVPSSVLPYHAAANLTSMTALPPSIPSPSIHTGENAYESDPRAGTWGGTCICPDGGVYLVGDRKDSCNSLACFHGRASTCSRHEGEWSHRSVHCAAAHRSLRRKAIKAFQENGFFMHLTSCRGNYCPRDSDSYVRKILQNGIPPPLDTDCGQWCSAFSFLHPSVVPPRSCLPFSTFSCLKPL